MKKSVFVVCAWAGGALLGFSGLVWAAYYPQTAPAPGPMAAAAPDITGTFELVKRVLPDGKEIVPPAISGLYTNSHGRRNFNVAWTDKDGKPASLSIIATYTLTADKYCETIEFWLQNNIGGKPGVSNEAPPTKDCSPVTVKDGVVTFSPPGEMVVVSIDKYGLTATAAGQFADHWKKLR